MSWRDFEDVTPAEYAEPPVLVSCPRGCSGAEDCDEPGEDCSGCWRTPAELDAELRFAAAPAPAADEDVPF